MQEVKYPKKLNPIPIVASVVELKFETTVPSDVVFGVLYTSLSKEFPKINKLPILQIPLEIREREQNLIFSPYYELYDDEALFKILIGPRVLAVVFNKFKNDYPGWTGYLKEKVEHIFRQAFETKIISNINRLGIRYTDFFEQNIFEHIKLQVSHDSENIGVTEKIQLTRQVSDSMFSHQMLFSNNSEIKILGNSRYGSIVDIDTYIEEPEKDFFHNNYINLIQEGHDLNKKHFFNLIKAEFINEYFNPTF